MVVMDGMYQFIEICFKVGSEHNVVVLCEIQFKIFTSLTEVWYNGVFQICKISK